MIKKEMTAKSKKKIEILSTDCTQCGKVFHEFEDDPVIHCPHCGVNTHYMGNEAGNHDELELSVDAITGDVSAILINGKGEQVWRISSSNTKQAGES